MHGFIFQRSPSEAESYEDDDTNSMSTKVGGYAQNEAEPNPPMELGEIIKPSIRKTGYDRPANPLCMHVITRIFYT